MVRVAVALVVVESSETDDGLSEQPIFAVEDEMLHDRLTVPLNPPVALTVMVESARLSGGRNGHASGTSRHRIVWAA